MTLPRRGSNPTEIDGVPYRWILRDTLEVPSPTWADTRLYHVIVAQREDGVGPRLHGMLAGPPELNLWHFTREVDAWLERLLARRDVDRSRADVYDHPHGLSVWPHDWPAPPP